MTDTKHTTLKLSSKSTEEHSVPLLTSPWKILIVDDESEVHTISRLILKDLVFDDHPTQILNAYSAEQAKEILQKDDDIALILLDVVMETDSAGLDLIDYIRHTLNNHLVRIILRTGYPGQAPESKVIFEYDINDYKAKNELTARKLMTSVIAALRAYGTIRALHDSRKGLELILESTDKLMQVDSLNQFASGVLIQLSSFLSTKPDGILCLQTSLDEQENLTMIASLGALKVDDQQQTKEQSLIEDALQIANEAVQAKQDIFKNQFYAIYLEAANMSAAVAVLYGIKRFSKSDQELLTLYRQKVSIALQNILKYHPL